MPLAPNKQPPRPVFPYTLGVATSTLATHFATPPPGDLGGSSGTRNEPELTPLSEAWLPDRVVPRVATWRDRAPARWGRALISRREIGTQIGIHLSRSEMI